MSPSFDFAKADFSAASQAVAQAATIFLRHFPSSGPLCVLEIGCGVGALALEVAQRRSDVSLVGVDISLSNITVARRQAEAVGCGACCAFVAEDYLVHKNGRYGVIFSDGVLPFIRATADALAMKLANDLEDDGILLVVMPWDSWVNRRLIGLRRLMRWFRSPWMDAALLALAQRLHPTWDASQLRDRIPYLYIIPGHLDSAGFRASLERAGLIATGRWLWPNSSLVKLRHRLVIYRKRSQVDRWGRADERRMDHTAG